MPQASEIETGPKTSHAPWTHLPMDACDMPAARTAIRSISIAPRSAAEAARRSATFNLSPAIAHTLQTFKRRQAKWAESATQDAIESVARISWWQQVRTGIHVPLDTLYTVSVHRLARGEVEQFALRQAPQMGLIVGVPPSALQRIALHAIRHTPPPPAPANPCFQRRWSEPEIPWRRRFESELRSEIHLNHTVPLVDWIESTSLRIVSRWNQARQRRLVSKRMAR